MKMARKKVKQTSGAGDSMEEQRREAALQAITECKTLTAAADKAGLSRTTLWMYFKDRDFCERLRMLKEARALERAELATEARRVALDTLTAVMNDPAVSPQIRINAAKIMLEDANTAIQGEKAVFDDVIGRYNSSIGPFVELTGDAV